MNLPHIKAFASRLYVDGGGSEGGDSDEGLRLPAIKLYPALVQTPRGKAERN